MLHAGGVAAGAAPVDWQGALMGAVDELWSPAGDAPGALDELADRLIEWTGGRAPVPGLTLLLATRSRRPHDDLRLDVPAVATELAGLRTALTGWLERLGAGAWARTAVPLVVSELASNAVEHAYPADRPGRVRVEALLAGRDGLLVTVDDDGRWAPPRPRPGYGLVLARDLSDDMRVDPSDAGTRVCARFALSRPAVAHSSGGRTRPHPAVAAELEVTEPAGGPSVVAVRGRVDRPVLAELRSALLRASRGGTRPVVLDLTAATAVAAAGVRLLYELDRSAEPPIRVRAPASSVAHDVLSLAGLDRLLDHPG
jgi:anti-sigma regulatory factor (Ser/Thr protein kinase)/anti-anti-sigma regulatory factor